MSRDRQIAVLASIVGLAGLIVGIVAISQVSGAEDDWVRNRALPGAASSEGAVLQTQVAVQEVADLTERVAEIERRDTFTERASTEADEESDTANVAVQGMTNEVADLTKRVAELEKTPVPEGPEEVSPTEEIPTEEVEYPEEVDQTSVPVDESGATEELTEELLTPPPTEPESLGIPDQPMALPSIDDEDSDVDASWYISGTGEGLPAYILHRELVVPIKSTGIVYHEIWGNCTFWFSIGDCSKPVAISDVEYSVTEMKHYVDDFIMLGLRCPNVINLIPDGWSDGTADHTAASELYWAHPTVTLSKLANDLPLTYWLAPSESNNIDNWMFEYEAGSSAERKPWEDFGFGIVQLEWEEVIDPAIATTELTIIVENTQTGELYYIDLTVSLSYELISKSSNVGDAKAGLGPSRCSADLTFIRSYP
jgi:hypothetical protein